MLNKKNVEKMTTTINKEFLIRYKYETDKKTRLISGGQYHKLVGIPLALKHFNKVLENGLDKTIIKLRRGLTINFISK